MNKEDWPLAGIRVIDLTWWVAGPEATLILASLGAEVIKVEWRKNPDPVRYGSPVVTLKGEPVREVRQMGFRDPTTGPNRGGNFNNINAGKRGITLNVKDPRGHDLLKQLISMSDIVIENFSAGVMKRWGLDYPDLIQIKDDIIYLSMSGLGHTGRDSDYVTMGPGVQALSGLTANSGLPARPPAGWGFSYTDYVAGYFGAMSILYALNHRKVTGKGQYIDLSQVECGTVLNGLPIMDYSANPRLPFERTGNRAPYGRGAPHGIYRCQGVDKWVAIAVFDDPEWENFRKALGYPTWAEDPRFKDQEARHLHQDELDRLVEEWTTGRTPLEVQTVLQRYGVRAGAVQDAEALLSDESLNARHAFPPLRNSEVGEWPVIQIPIRYDRLRASVGGTIGRAAPTLGEDNVYVYQTLLGLGRERFEQYVQEDVI